MSIEPMDGFWKQMFAELENTTDEQWMQFVEDYERRNRPMFAAIELCNTILQLIEDLGEPSFLRFDDITIVNTFGEYDCYGDKTLIETTTGSFLKEWFKITENK